MERGDQMTNDDKTFVLTGFMFIAVFFLLLIALNVFITNAAAIALLVAMLTYLFFDTCYYVKKTECYANSKQSETNKMNFNSIIQWEDKSCKR